MTICTFNASSLASDESVEDLMMQARKIMYDVIGLTETRRHHSLYATYDSGEELFLETCDSGGVSGDGVLVNTQLAMKIDSYESLTSRLGRLRLKDVGRSEPTVWRGTSKFHNEIDHIIFNCNCCLNDVFVERKQVLYGIGPPPLSREVLLFVSRRESLEVKEEESQNDHQLDLYTFLAGLLEDTVMDNIDEE
ncbi:unnamed protein product [Heligmosomoides polygyrus]|uniref:Endo/exonuclease/phosphatase domain-containing protein n=1 Tax=Heligmosomoides polygyrus TaxID=6339 RepID=A0A183G3F4_HELPZ|nr:unnamed protein product [Heligmosomoides polygyrus]